ncbi:MAG: leucyl/phenylalanyl-tRNA--protein transferase [Chlamydiia bacterium]|nr:leucyl/phenylalanyl-tRNA--protein transferase [Chlamydiia bacterium]
MYLLDDNLTFPHPSLANEDGVLAIGGELNVDRLLLAYRNGIFPWFEEGEPIVWWSPNPRMVLYPSMLKVSKSMRKVIKQEQYKVTFDKSFASVIDNCKTIFRADQGGTWITSDMKEAYLDLHNKGIAHSVEVWEGEELVGGLYGVNVGRVFCGESMFSKKSNTSKLAFISLVQKLSEQDYHMVDCQLYTDHLASLGAEEISRDIFLEELNGNRDLVAWDFTI